MGEEASPGLLSGIALFRGLSTEELARVGALLHRKGFPAGASVVSAQQPGEAVYVVLEGSVKISMEQEDGSEVTFAILGPGDTVGEMSLIDRSTRSANAVTLQPSVLLWMDRRSFSDCLRTIPGLNENLLREISGRLRQANRQIEALSRLSVRARLARQIQAFADQYGRRDSDGSVLIPLPLTQGDLAQLIGATRERVNRAMVALKQEGIVQQAPDRLITVRDPTALESSCHPEEVG